MYPIEIALQNFKHFLKEGSITESEVPFIKIGLDRLPFFAVPIFRRQIGRIFRVSVNHRMFQGEQKRIKELKYLRNPDKSIVTKMGRANLSNQSVLYGGFEPLTILNELKPNNGDLITITEWQLNTDKYINLTPIFKKTDVYNNNELSLKFQTEYKHALKGHCKQEVEQREVLLSFLADCFAKPVNSCRTDYYLSAHFTNYMFNEFENGIIDVILYPSVKVDGAFMNIAMDSQIFKNNYVVKEIKESIITFADHSKRKYLMNSTGITRKVDGEQIIWN